jgi:hypothetical protein
MTFEQEQKAAEEAAARADFKMNYHGTGDPDEAFDMTNLVAEVEAREQKAAKPDKTQLARIGETLNAAVTAAARFRSGDEMTTEERADIVKAVLADAGKLPAALKASLQEEIVRQVDAVRTSGNTTAAFQDARAASYRIALSAPRTWIPDTDSAADIAAIMAEIPRA